MPFTGSTAVCACACMMHGVCGMHACEYMCGCGCGVHVCVMCECGCMQMGGYTYVHLCVPVHV